MPIGLHFFFNVKDELFCFQQLPIGHESFVLLGQQLFRLNLA